MTNRSTTLLEEFRNRVGAALDLLGTVLAISQIPYGRPTDLSPGGVIASWRGTCSTKHMLLAALMREAWPQVPFSLWHRVYRVERAWAAERWVGRSPTRFRKRA